MADVATKVPDGTGRSKEAVARVRLREGTGRFELNGRPLEAYFPSRAHRMIVTAPLRVVGREKDFDIDWSGHSVFFAHQMMLDGK